MTSTFNFCIHLADRDCNEKSYDVVKKESTPQLGQQTQMQEQKQKGNKLELKGSAISIDYLNSRNIKIEGDAIKNVPSDRSEAIEGSYRCIEIRFDDKQILALRNISDEKYIPERSVDVDAYQRTTLNISDEKVFKIIRVDRGKGDWHVEYQGFDKICRIEKTEVKDEKGTNTQQAPSTQQAQLQEAEDKAKREAKFYNVINPEHRVEDKAKREAKTKGRYERDSLDAT